MIVRVYRNSQKNQWAVVKVGGGNRKVTFYADELTLTSVAFHTGLKGKHRVCKSGHVNRHNYAEGKLASFRAVPKNPGQEAAGTHMATYATYNKSGEFEAKVDNAPKPVIHSRRAEFTTYGARYVVCASMLCGETE